MHFCKQLLHGLHFYICWIYLLHALLFTSSFFFFPIFFAASGWWRQNQRWGETAITLSPQMTNPVVILLKCDWPCPAARHPYLFCHLCSKLSPTDYNSSLHTWSVQSPAGGGVCPHNVKWNSLAYQDGQMREVWSWLILCLSVCLSIYDTVSINLSSFFCHSYHSLCSSSVWSHHLSDS